MVWPRGERGKRPTDDSRGKFELSEFATFNREQHLVRSGQCNVGVSGFESVGHSRIAGVLFISIEDHGRIGGDDYGNKQSDLWLPG